MRPTEKEHSDTIVTMASIGLESRLDIGRSFFVQNIQFIGEREPALPETVLEKLATTVASAGRSPLKRPPEKNVPLVQEHISQGCRQVRS